MDKLTSYFEDEFSLSHIDKIKLRYSLEVIINDTSKLLILFILFYILGKGSDFLYSVLALFTIRPFTGGLHFKTYTSCLIFTCGFFTTSIILTKNVPINSIFLLLLVFSFTTILLLAPITSKNRPSYSNKKQLNFKLIGLAVIIFHFIAYLIANKNPYLNNSIWVIVLQSIQLLIKWGVGIFENKKKHYQKFT